MKPSGRPILAAFKRAYSAQAQAARASSLPKQDIQVSRLADGTVLASLENYSPVARVAVVYNAGPRYESGNQLGLTHCLRNAFSLSTEKSTGFNMTRSIQQMGGNLGCTSTREHMAYTLECLRDNVDEGVRFLGEVSCRPVFNPWEVERARPRLRVDHSVYMENPQARLMEALHQAAFRGGLEKSLYAAEHKINNLNADMLSEFVSKHYVGGNMAIVGTGITHEQLSIFAREMKINNGTAPVSTPSTYSGEQVRIDANCDLVYAAIATEGVGMSSADLLKLYVLQFALGSGTYVKYGSNLSTSKVSQAAAKGTNAPFAATCFNATYSDTGLFGFQVITQASDATNVIKAVGASMADATKGSITDADLQRAKNQLTASIMMAMENGNDTLLDMGVQAIVSGNVLTVDSVKDAIAAVTAADVQNIAKKVMNGRPCMAAIGDLSNTPYLDQVF